MSDFIEEYFPIILVVILLVGIFLCEFVRINIGEEERKKCINNKGTVIEKYNGNYNGCIYKGD